MIGGVDPEISEALERLDETDVAPDLTSRDHILMLLVAVVPIVIATLWHILY